MKIEDLLKPEYQALLNEMNNAMTPIIEKINAEYQKDESLSIKRMQDIAEQELKTYLPEGSYDFVRLFAFPVVIGYYRSTDPCR